jgi:hypothetical protein
MKTKILNFSFSLVFIIGLFSCKKDNEENAAKAMYIEKIFLNGHLSKSLEYDNFLIQKIKNYDTTGKIINYSTYEYNGNNKVSRNHNYNFNGVSIGLITNEYNSHNQLIKATTYANDTSGIVTNTNNYEYDAQGRCIKLQVKSSVVEFYYIYDYENGNRKNGYIYDLDNTLKATTNYSYDNKNNFMQFQSITPVVYSQHNIVSWTSSGVDENGVLSVKFLKGSASFALFNSTYEYNSDNFPIKETRTLVDKRRKVEVYEYQYLK